MKWGTRWGRTSWPSSLLAEGSIALAPVLEHRLQDHGDFLVEPPEQVMGAPPHEVTLKTLDRLPRRSLELSGDLLPVPVSPGPRPAHIVVAHRVTDQEQIV